MHVEAKDDYVILIQQVPTAYPQLTLASQFEVRSNTCEDCALQEIVRVRAEAVSLSLLVFDHGMMDSYMENTQDPRFWLFRVLSGIGHF